jgi:hypothetical protein
MLVSLENQEDLSLANLFIDNVFVLSSALAANTTLTSLGFGHCVWRGFFYTSTKSCFFYFAGCGTTKFMTLLH